jgi:hypothetical protein
LDLRFISSTKKVIAGAVAAGAIVLAQELTKSKVVPLLGGAPAATGPALTVATDAPALPAPAPSLAVPSISSVPAPAAIPAPAADPPAAPSPPVEIEPQKAPGSAVPTPTPASEPPANPGPEPGAPPRPVAAPAPSPTPADPMQAVFRGEFDQALTIARTNGKDEALTEGLESFAQAGRLIQKSDWTGARDALRNAERTPALKKLSLYWRCRVSKLEIGAENFDRCASEAGVNPSAYR